MVVLVGGLGGCFGGFEVFVWVGGWCLFWWFLVGVCFGGGLVFGFVICIVTSDLFCGFAVLLYWLFG